MKTTLAELLGLLFFVITLYKLVDNHWAFGLSLLISSVVYFVIVIIVSLILDKYVRD